MSKWLSTKEEKQKLKLEKEKEQIELEHFKLVAKEEAMQHAEERRVRELEKRHEQRKQEIFLHGLNLKAGRRLVYGLLFSTGTPPNLNAFIKAYRLEKMCDALDKIDPVDYLELELPLTKDLTEPVKVED